MREPSTPKMRERENEPPPTPWGDYPLPLPKPYRPLIKSYLHLTAGNCSRQTLATAPNIPRIQRPWFHPLDLTIFIRLLSSAGLHPLFVAIQYYRSSIHCSPKLSFMSFAVHSCRSCPSLQFGVLHCLSVSFVNCLFIHIS